MAAALMSSPQFGFQPAIDSTQLNETVANQMQQIMAMNIRMMAARALMAQQMQTQAQINPVPKQSPALVVPVATQAPAATQAQRRNRRRKKAKGSEDKDQEERRLDPSDRKLKTRDEFLMDHAIGADFSEGEKRWEAALSKTATPRESPPPAVVVPLATKGVRFAEGEGLEVTVPQWDGPTQSILKARSKLSRTERWTQAMPVVFSREA